MPAHSLDLRRRGVAAYQAGGSSIRQVAERFIVTKPTVHRWVRQYHQTQDLTLKTAGTKRIGVLDQHYSKVMESIENYPDKCLWQYRDILSE